MNFSVLMRTTVLSVGLLTLSKAALSQNGSLHFDGNGRYVHFTQNPIAQLSGDHTIETWFYFQGGGPWQRIIGFGNSDIYIALMPNIAGGGIWYAISNTTESQQQLLATSTPLQTNMWHHIAITVEHATHTGKMYLNGSLIATNTSMTLRPSQLTSLYNFRFGRSNFLGDPFFHGYIDQIRFSTTVRYHSNFTPSKGDLALDHHTSALWLFNEGSGQTLHDASPNHFDGIIGSTGAADSEDPTWSFFSALPIKFQDFTVHKKSGSHSIKWSTSKIDNDAKFIVERSDDRQAFTPIHTEHVKENQLQTNFEIADHRATGSTVYYRIKLVEPAGEHYSKVIAIRNQSTEDFKVFPSHTTGTLYINTSIPAQFTIVDLNGKIVKQFNANGNTSIDVSVLTPGIYHIQNGSGKTTSFVKQ